MRNNGKKLLYLSLLAFFAMSGGVSRVGAQSADAIAIRVLPNIDNLSAQEWYKRQNFSGSPQKLAVDGYNAIRDGRTVYVNAANVNGGSFYTNIYLISYNQEAEDVTQDLFGEMLKHWRFNSNFPDTGLCSVTTGHICLNDSDCPLGEQCSSDKARIVRDTKRLEAVGDISRSLGRYYEDKNSYPILSSGTYIPHYSLSVWPSWQLLLEKELDISLPLDPINSLGDCAANFNSLTCWDHRTQTFADPIPANGVLDFPAGSRIITYMGSADGASYEVCCFTESGMLPYEYCLSS